MTKPGANPSIWDTKPLDPTAILLTDKVAIVTGAAQGIGEATALALARFGAHVAVCDRKREGVLATGREIEALGRRTHVGVLDVRDEDAASVGGLDGLGQARPVRVIGKDESCVGPSALSAPAHVHPS